MAAGVHDTYVFTGVFKAGFLGDGQGIHIRAQQDGLAGLAALDSGQHAGLQTAGPPGNAISSHIVYAFYPSCFFLQQPRLKSPETETTEYF